MSGNVAGDVATKAPGGAAGPSEAGTPRQGFTITGGGEPDPAQLAALVVALSPVSNAPTETGPPPWRHAALLEGVGGPAILTPGDIDVASPRGR